MNLLKEIRTKKGFSQLTLAKLTNIAPTDISRMYIVSKNGTGLRLELTDTLGGLDKLSSRQ